MSPSALPIAQTKSAVPGPLLKSSLVGSPSVRITTKFLRQAASSIGFPLSMPAGATQLPTEASPDMYSAMSTSASARGVHPEGSVALIRPIRDALFPLAIDSVITPPFGSPPAAKFVSPKRTFSLKPAGLISSSSAFLAVSIRSTIGIVGVLPSMIS